MNNFEHIRNFTIDEMAEWLDKHGNFEDSPWINWFDDTYCQNCENVKGKMEDGREMEFAYCEIFVKCRFFDEFDEAPWGEDLIKLWLEKEC